MSRQSLFSGVASLLATLLVPAAATAQSTVIAGVKGGVTVANIDFSAEGVSANFKSRVGGIGGGYVGVDLTKYFGISVEGLFAQKGTKTTDADFDEDGTLDDLEIRVNYFEVPILVHARLMAGDSAVVRLYGGPAIGFKVSEAEKLDGSEVDEDLGLKSYDVGMTLGASVTVKHLILDARYTWGILNLNDEDSDEFEVKNRAFAVMFGWAFR